MNLHAAQSFLWNRFLNGLAVVGLGPVDVQVVDRPVEVAVEQPQVTRRARRRTVGRLGPVDVQVVDRPVAVRVSEQPEELQSRRSARQVLPRAVGRSERSIRSSSMLGQAERAGMVNEKRTRRAETWLPRPRNT